MQKLLLTFVLFFTALPSRAQPVKARVDSLLEYYAQNFNYNGVAFVSVKGKILIKKAYGYQDYYKNIKNEPDNIFMIGSITKQFTAELILMLAKENKLNLQDKLSVYFPAYPSGDKITIEHLLTHSSGIYNYTEEETLMKHPAMPVSQKQLMAVFKDKPLAFEPGSRFEYSNSGYLLLSYIIEQVTGKPYTQVARERILTPLKMTHSGFDFTHLKDKRKVTGYNSTQLDSFYTEPVEDSTQSLGAGALYSTIDDLYKWHRALQSYTLLDKEWQQKAYVPYKDKYGYGWFILDYPTGQKVLAHSGGIPGFNTFFTRIEKEDVCIVLLSNIRFSGVALNEVSKNIIKCLYDTAFRVPAIRKEIKLPETILKRYEGEYVLAEDTSLSITFAQRGQYLYSTITGQPEDRIYPQTEQLFFTRTADAQFEFVSDKKGRYSLLLHQHGQKFEATLRK